MADESAAASPIVAIAAVARMFEVVLEDYDLTIQKYRVLLYLEQGPASPTELAYRLTVRPPVVTRLVDGLVDRGLVSRAVDEADRRRSTLAVTEAGRRAKTAADESIMLRLERILSGVSERDRATSERGLRILGAAMRRFWASTHPDAR
jgi:DNA-binding MarR family transcriptional regulator